ncbi:hypothetical protein [Hydrogenophaga sp.]|uniref:hypothetical protein n=1 Tax=Hydrogenophaga sp. TaxID=1904254 RepID=UPI0035B40C82
MKSKYMSMNGKTIPFKPKLILENRRCRARLNAKGDGGFELSIEERVWQQVNWIEEFLTEVLRQEGRNGFAYRSIVMRRTKRSVFQVTRSRLMEKLRDLDPFLLDAFRAKMGNAEYRPRVEAFIKHTKQWASTHNMEESWARSKDQVEAFVDQMNEYVRTLIALLRSPVEQRRDRVWRNVINKNIASVKEYVAALREVATLKVVRMEFGYAPGVAMSLKRIDPGSTQGAVDARALADHRERWLRMVSRRLNKDLLGYLWRTDFSMEGGFRLHVHVFVRASKSEPEDILGSEMGRLWVHEVNRGWGTFVCFNSRGFCYEDTTIGFHDRSNDGKAEKLCNAIAHELEMDARVRARAFDETRCFGRGLLPRVKETKPMKRSNRGALTPWDIQAMSHMGAESIR